MASSLPSDILRTASQRFLYNIDLIEKRYANKRPSGLELDVDSGKIIQVVDAKRPRLTAEEAKEKMKKSFLAPPSLFGNSSLCSPFVHDMTTSRETKKRVLKHNRRFKEQLDDGFDCTSTLFNDENDNNQASEDDGDAENREEEELFDLDDILDDDDNDADDEEEEYGDIEEELSESEEEDIGLEDEQNQELEDELDNEKEAEETFEIPEEEAEKEGNSYKNLKITRALIQRLTPKVSRGKKAAKSTSFKKRNSLIDQTPKTSTKKEKDNAAASKKDVVQSTPIRSSKKKAVFAKSTPATKTPTVTKKSTKAAPEESPHIIPSSKDILKKTRGRTKQSFVEAAPMEITPVTASKNKKAASVKRAPTTKTPTVAKKITKAASEKGTSKKQSSSGKAILKKLTAPLIEDTPKNSRGCSRKSAPLSADVPQNVTSATVSKANKTAKAVPEDSPPIIPSSESTLTKIRGRTRQSFVEAAEITPATVSNKKKVVKSASAKSAPTTKTPAVSTKIIKAASEKAISKKSTPKRSTRGRELVAPKRLKF
uniref:Uncharacterized protein n=1 Tax=Panagrolaimus sp. ES5 TaxID=591445 RepID=A0AC34GXY0_9BILA